MAPDRPAESDPGPILAATRRFFAADGPLAARLGSSYEVRPEQVAMAETVVTALVTDDVALIEAGTGTGKTLAYLAPTAFWAGRVVVSTHTRNLQDQIAGKDVRLLEEALGFRLGDTVVMKGLANYLCRRRFDAFLGSGLAPPPGLDGRFDRFADWARTTTTGDKTEIDWMGDDDPLWREVCSGADVRVGARCPHFDRCFVTKLRRAAAEAKLVVVNHHLFFADLAVPDEAGSRVLPPWDAAIFDEAHDLEDAAASFFGVRMSSHRFELLRTGVARRVGALGAGMAGGTRRTVLESLDRAMRLVADLLGALAAGALRAAPPGASEPGRRAPLGGALGSADAVDAHRAADDALGTLVAAMEAAGAGDPETAVMAARCAALRADLRCVMEGDDDEHVAWIEGAGRRDPPGDGEWGAAGARRPGRRRGRCGASAGGDGDPGFPPGLSIGRTPIEVAGILRDRLIAPGRPIVFTSATLADHRGFGFAGSRLGIEREVIELRLPSSFDFARQALLYTPAGMPEPRDPGFLEAVLRETEALLGVTGGGALLLYTSFRAQRWMAEALRASGRDRVLVQGEAPRDVLLRRLRAERDAVLLATASFWQGVDVAGDSLRLVVIDKLPFDVPSDPVVAARIERIRRRGGNPFDEYQVPVASIALRQGFGRLIRARTDRGIVAVLDPRIRTKRYGRAFLEALPRCAQAAALADVADWWNGPVS